MNLWSTGEEWNKSLEYEVKDESMEKRRRMELIYGVKEKNGLNLWSTGGEWNESME